jgi:hypothetical protein
MFLCWGNAKEKEKGIRVTDSRKRDIMQFMRGHSEWRIPHSVS